MQSPNRCKGVCAALALALMACAVVAATLRGQAETEAPVDYREAALKAAHWIASTGIESGQERVWPADSADPKTVRSDL